MFLLESNFITFHLKEDSTMHVYVYILSAAILDVDRRLNASLGTNSICHITVIQEARFFK